MVRKCDEHRDRGRRSGGRRPAHIRGFTLIEILIVVIILGIASTITLAQLSTNNDLVAGAAARTIMGDLLYAQNRAIATQQTHYVVFSVADQNYSVYSGMPSSATLLQHPVNLNDYTMTFGGTTNSVGNVTLTSVNFGNNQTAIAFDPMGLPYYYTAGVGNTLISGSGTIKISAGNYSLTISVAQDTGDTSVN